MTTKYWTNLYTLILVLTSVQLSSAQMFTIKAVGPFPLIESVQRPAIAKKLNTIIQTDLGADPNSPNPFDSLDTETDFSYDAWAVNDRVLSITTTSSYAGCGLHITRHDYIFDSRTGNKIESTQLFGTDGGVKLEKMLLKAWKAALTAALKDERFGGDYKNCLAAAAGETGLAANRMVVTDHSIKFWAGYCLEGTTYEFEADQGQGPHEFSFGQLLPLLTPYGHSLFVEKSQGPIQTLLRGTIDNKYPISMTLLPAPDGSAPGTIGGMIVYDRVGEPINLNGTMNGNLLVFHEVDASNNPLSNIEVAWDGTKLSGTFVNLKSKKQMPFAASVVGEKKK